MAENKSPPPLMTDKELLMETGAFNEIMNAAFEYADAYCSSGDEPRRYAVAIDNLRKTVRAEIARFSRGNYAALPATEDSSAGDLAEASHQTKLLAQALGDCILASGIVRSDLDMNGPQLLMFAEDLKELLLARQAEVQAEPVALQMCSELKPRTKPEKAAYLAGVADGRRYAERDADTAPQAQPADALDVPIRQLIRKHAALLAENESAYFELCYHRATGWMAWITDRPLCMPPVINPGRKVIAQGQGDTAEEACSDAMAAAQEGGKAAKEA